MTLFEMKVYNQGEKNTAQRLEGGVEVTKESAVRECKTVGSVFV